MGKMCRRDIKSNYKNNMIKLIPDNFDPLLYNSVVNHPLQTWEWGQARQSTGIKILRLGKFLGEKLKKTYLMTLHHIPFTNFNIGYIPRSDLPTKELLEFLKNFYLINILFLIHYSLSIKMI